jgi:hypothetical protein
LQQSIDVSDIVEIYHLRHGPDGLSLITMRRLGEPESRAWLVPTEVAEDTVLDEWAELHDAVLGYPPNWQAENEAHSRRKFVGVVFEPDPTGANIARAMGWDGSNSVFPLPASRGK